MMTIGILLILCTVEVALFARFAKKKSFNALTRAVARITLFALFLIFCTLGFIDWGLKWYALSLLLGIKAILGIISLLRKKAPIDKKKNKTVPRLLGNIALIGMVMIPPLVFPGYKQPQPTGRHSVGTTVFTWTDASREDSFTEKEDRRRVTVQFWYPLAEAEENSEVPERPFPLIVFSHGAFGYRMSNHSTFLELASNGYVVASIDHTHQAFLTKEADGTQSSETGNSSTLPCRWRMGESKASSCIASKRLGWIYAALTWLLYWTRSASTLHHRLPRSPLITWTLNA